MSPFWPRLYVVSMEPESKRLSVITFERRLITLSKYLKQKVSLFIPDSIRSHSKMMSAWSKCQRWTYRQIAMLHQHAYRHQVTTHRLIPYAGQQGGERKWFSIILSLYEIELLLFLGVSALDFSLFILESSTKPYWKNESSKTGSSLANALNSVDVKILSDPQCKASNIGSIMWTDKMFCAGWLEGGKDACHVSTNSPKLIYNLQQRVTPAGR